jgi:hypothetical protein
MKLVCFTKYWGDQIKEDEMDGACSTHGRDGNLLVGKPNGKRPLGRLRRRWEDNIREIMLGRRGLGASG